MTVIRFMLSFDKKSPLTLSRKTCPAECWSGRDLNALPSAQKSDAQPTEPIGRPFPSKCLSHLFPQALSRDPTEVWNIERLELQRRDWASKVFGLIFAVDDVTVGTSAPVEQLTSAACAGDQHVLQENSRMLTSYSRTLKDTEIGSTAG